jgi:TDG/mug DNA glycosylase family protein
MRKSSFDAVCDERTTVIVLGSLPGEISLARQQYYANPTNQFWRLIGGVLETDLVSLAYEDRLAALLKRGVGLWDVVQSAARSTSADSAIQRPVAHDLLALTARLPHLRGLGFNGGKAAAIGLRQLGSQPPCAAITLPSSSAAHCRITYADKLQSWLELRRLLD